ncbi:MAG TPA: nucleotidyltransferase domain-containing protein [Ktedonobacterales bacterium]
MGQPPARQEALRTTGDARVDLALADVRSTFDVAFSARILGWYALGSYADDSAIAASDLDLTVVFAGAMSDEERQRAERLRASLVQRCPVELDIELEDEQTLARGASPNFKLGSALVWGEDIRERLPLVSLAAWTRDRMHSSWWRIARLFARPTVITLPVEYPEPADPFRGYTRRTLRLADGEDVPCTRDLIRLIGWAATGLLALQCGVYVARKSDVHRLYRERIGGEWARLIEDVYTLCRMRWGYLIPNDAAERERLRDLCDQTLGFERHFSACYRKYLLAELCSDDPEATRFAAEVMSRAPMRDDATLAALASVAQRRDTDGAPLARAALAQMRHADDVSETQRD